MGEVLLLLVWFLVGVRVLVRIVGIEGMSAYRIVSSVYIGIDSVLVGVGVIRLVERIGIGMRRKIRRMRRHHII